MLVELGYRVVCPDMMGYGGTDAPRVPPEPLSTYSFKRAAEDIRQLAINLGSTSITLGGHDWVSARVASRKGKALNHGFGIPREVQLCIW